jgi:hypothetical protein
MGQERGGRGKRAGKKTKREDRREDRRERTTDMGAKGQEILGMRELAV